MPGRERLVLRGVLLVVLSSVVVVWWKPDPGGFRSMSLVVQASVVALTAAFAVYCVAKEVQLSRLRRMALDERMPTMAPSTRLRELALLLEAGKAMNSLLELPQVLAAILRSALELLGAANGSVMLLHEGGTELRSVCWFGDDAAGDARQKVGEGVAGAVAESGRALLINAEERPGELVGAACHPTPVRSAMSAPLVHHDEVIGVLNVDAESERRFTEYDLAALRLFAEQAASTIAKARLVETHRAQAEQLAHLAFHDSLTGVANRVLFLDHAGQALHRARRQPGAVAVLFIDLDRFKDVNDRFGHAAGDELLADVADRIRGVIRPTDTLARLGGDEFVVLCEGLTGEVDGVRVAARIEEALGRPFRLAAGEARVTASVGIALAAEGEDDPEALVRDADTAMYRAKEGGKNRHEVFCAAMRVGAMARLRTESLLRHALERDSLRLAYHPVVDLRDGLVAAGAVVLRLAGGNGGIVPPEEFLDVAEDTRLIVPLGNWAVREACRQAALSRADDGAGPVAVHIEVSAVQLHADGFAAAVAAAVVQSGLDAGRLFLTVSERALPRLTPAAVATLEELAATGVHVGIAGFGAGLTALPELRRLPIDFLTMDPSLVRGVDDNARAASVVESVVRAAAALHLTVVAAGVETDEQAGALRRLGCSLAQGPYFGRPRGSFPWRAGWD